MVAQNSVEHRSTYLNRPPVAPLGSGGASVSIAPELMCRAIGIVRENLLDVVGTVRSGALIGIVRVRGFRPTLCVINESQTLQPDSDGRQLAKQGVEQGRLRE